MIRITIELWPSDGRAVEEIGRIEIANDGTGAAAIGDYDVILYKTPKYGATRGGVWRAGKVRGFPRLAQGPYDLLYRALAVTVGRRNVIEPETQPKPPRKHLTL